MRDRVACPDGSRAPSLYTPSLSVLAMPKRKDKSEPQVDVEGRKEGRKGRKKKRKITTRTLFVSGVLVTV